MKMNRLFPVGVLLLLALTLAGAGCGKPTATASAATPKYHCPMHPAYVSDRPGDCPICNMKLVPIKGGEAGPAATASNAVPGRVTVMVSPEKQQLIGLRFSTVMPRDLSHQVRATGVLQHDETTLSRIAPRFGGWVRQLFVNYTGQAVEKGQPLLTVYSPELLATESEYLLAWRQQQQAKDAPVNQREAAERLLDSARRRLELWQVGDEEIRALEARGQPSDELLLRSPMTGHVIAKAAVEGRAFTAGETLYEIGELHRLWVRAAVDESELAWIHVGDPARVVFPGLADRVVESTVAFIYPHIDPRTRRAEIRLEIPNANHELRPDMWANVEIEGALGRRLSVPASALIDTGTRYLAFVQGPDHHLEPREVKIGARTPDFDEVLAGLRDGEKVVTRALFLVDSESQLKAAIAGMTAGDGHEH